MPTAVPNLDVVETLDSEKLASLVDKSWAASDKKDRLKVFIQINTSGEDSEFIIHRLIEIFFDLNIFDYLWHGKTKVVSMLTAL